MTRPTAWLLLTALVVGSWLGGCGGEAQPEVPAGRTRSLPLKPAAGSPEPDPPTRLAHYQVFGDVPKWRINSGSADVRRTDVGRDEKVSTLWLTGPVGDASSFEVRISGVFDPIEIDRLAAELVFRGKVSVQAELLRDRKRIATGTVAARNEGANTVHVRFDPPEDNELCDELMLKVSGADRLGIVALELFRDPDSAVLPSLRAPGPVEIEGEWRTAVGLSSKREMETNFLVQRGHALRVDYGLPYIARGPLPPKEIEIELTTEDGSHHVYNLPFEYDLVVVYSEHDPQYLKERRERSKLMRVKNPNKRANLKRKMERQAARKAPAAVAFGEKVEAKPRREKVDPASIPQGLVDGWITRTIRLDEFVGQKVNARFRLIAEPGGDDLAAISLPTLLGTRQETPLMVLITSDAHRADHLSAAGIEGAIETPWLEILAKRGVVFENAWSSTNDTLAAHEALFHGRPHHPLQVDGPASPSLPAVLSEAGWHTVAILSTPDFGPVRSDLTEDFDHVLAPHEEIGADGALDALIEMVPDLKDQASFVWVHLRDGLAPYDPPEEFRREHYAGGKDPKKRRRKEGDLAKLPDWAAGITDLGYVEALYSGEITWIDRRMRRVVEHPILSKAMIAFAGSFGESLTSFGHGALTPETLRVPLFITGPAVKAEHPVRRPANVHDLARTLLDMARKPDLPFSGTSLLERPQRPGQGQVKGGDKGTRRAGAPDRDAATAQTEDPERPAPVAPPIFATSARRNTAVVIQGGYLLRLLVGPDGKATGAARLHDLEIDPECEVNIKAAEPVLAAELKTLLEDWLATAPPVVAEAETPSPMVSGANGSVGTTGKPEDPGGTGGSGEADVPQPERTGARAGDADGADGENGGVPAPLETAAQQR